MGHRVEDPIIIVGTFRSASTLVAELLGSREDCHYLWFELSEELSRATGVPFGAPDSDDLLCPPLTSDDADDEQARSLRQVLNDRCHRDGVQPGVRLVIKNPHLWHRLGWVRTLLPEARLVVTVRDLRPTVASLKILWQRSLRQHAHMHHLPDDPGRCWDYVVPGESDRFAPARIFPGGSVGVLAEFWLRANRRLAAAVEAGWVAAVVRHERTLADPDSAAHRLQRSVGLDPVSLHPPEPIEPERQGDWRDRLEPAEHRALERFAARNRKELRAVDIRLDGPSVGSVMDGRRLDRVPRPRIGRTGDGTVEPLRVASVPATHIYVQRLQHPQVRRIQDPSGDDLRTPCLLDPVWVDEHAAGFDVFHVHFGVEFYDPRRIETLADVLDRHGIPLVFTCHDLRNPNHTSSGLHDGHLDVLLRRAAAVITLTDHAAAEIERQWSRQATVLPHPHVIPIEELRRRQSRPRPRHRDGHRVGIHLKSLRANMAPFPAVETALRTAREGDGLRVRIDVHHDVADPDHPNHDGELMQLFHAAVADQDAVADLHVHHYFSDDELWDYLESVDSFLLPYTFGTHSGLLEACRDLGTAVIAPTTGGYADQGAHHLFEASEADGIDRDDLRRALLEAEHTGRPDPVCASVRQRERETVAATHVDIYRQLLESQ